MSDLSKWTVAELKSELKEKGLSPSGRKAELILRLREFNKSKPDTDDTIVKTADNKEPVAKQTLNFSEVDEQESHETLEGESGGVPDAKQGQTHELEHSPTREDVSFVTMDEVLSSDEAENNTVCEEKEENKAIEKREIGSSERVQQDNQKTQDAMIIEDVAVKDGSNSGENSEEKTDSQAIKVDSVHTDQADVSSSEYKTTGDRDQDNAQHLGDNNMCESSETEEGVLYIDMDTDANENTDAKEGSVTTENQKSDVVYTSEAGQESSAVIDDQKNAKETKTEEGESVIILDDSGDETEAIKAQSQDNGDQNPQLTQSETFQPTQLPMPTGHFKNWLGKQLHLLGRERTLFVNPVSCKDQMCELLRDWGPKCADFQLHFSKEGTGAALLGFKTLESLNVAKTAISQLVGNDKVLQMTDLFYLENAVRKALNVDMKSIPDPASRSIVVIGAPRLTPENDILEFFPEAKMIMRPVKKREFKVELPPGVESHFFIEFRNPEMAKAALNRKTDMANKFQNVLVKSMVQYLEEFKEWEKNRSMDISMERDYTSQVMGDEERVRLSAKLHQIEARLRKRRYGKDGYNNMNDSVKALRNKLIRSLNQDAEMRRMTGKVLPEPEAHMTAFAKGLVRKMQQDTSQDMEVSDQEDTPSKIQVDVPIDSLTNDDKQKLLIIEINKLHPDENGYFTVSVQNHGIFIEKEKVLHQFSRYGEIGETTITKNEVYVSFTSRESAVNMLTDLLASREWVVSVPTSSQHESADQPSREGMSGSLFYKMFVTGNQPNNKSKKVLSDQPVTVNVSNINPATKMAKLTLFFNRFGPVLSINMDNQTHNKKSLSAAVTFGNAESAFKAVASHKSFLDGNHLVVTSAANVTQQQQQPQPQQPHQQLQQQQVIPPVVQDLESLRDKQVLVRELSYFTSEKKVSQYFSTFGKVSMCRLFTDGNGRANGSALVTFMEESSARDALQYQRNNTHMIDKRGVVVSAQKGSKYQDDIATQQTFPSLMSVQVQALKEIANENAPEDKKEEKDETLSNRQVFLCQLNLESTNESLTKYFSQFGSVEKCFVYCSKNKKSRGFALLTFEDESSVEKVLRHQKERAHVVDMKRIDVFPEKDSKRSSAALEASGSFAEAEPQFRKSRFDQMPTNRPSFVGKRGSVQLNSRQDSPQLSQTSVAVGFSQNTSGHDSLTQFSAGAPLQKPPANVGALGMNTSTASYGQTPWQTPRQEASASNSSNDAPTNTDLLKGLHQAISSKMQQITKLQVPDPYSGPSRPTVGSLGTSSRLDPSYLGLSSTPTLGSLPSSGIIPSQSQTVGASLNTRVPVDSLPGSRQILVDNLPGPRQTPVHSLPGPKAHVDSLAGLREPVDSLPVPRASVDSLPVPKAPVDSLPGLRGGMDNLPGSREAELLALREEIARDRSEQQQLLRQQELRMLQQQMEEVKLQKQLLELQKMKEAALKEVARTDQYRRNLAQ